MMLNNVTAEQTINMTAIAVSMLLHLILFVQFTNTTVNGQAQAPNFSTKISMNLLQSAKQPPQLVKADITPPESAHKPMLVPKPKSQVKPVIIKQALAFIPEQAAANKVTEQIQRGQLNNASPIRKKYLSNLLTHIESYKYYPQSARKRGIKGNIDVSFELHNNGEISGLKTSGGSMVLRKAAEQAISIALPFPAPPLEVNYPLQVSYAMQYQLN